MPRLCYMILVANEEHDGNLYIYIYIYFGAKAIHIFELSIIHIFLFMQQANTSKYIIFTVWLFTNNYYLDYLNLVLFFFSPFISFCSYILCYNFDDLNEIIWGYFLYLHVRLFITTFSRLWIYRNNKKAKKLDIFRNDNTKHCTPT